MTQQVPDAAASKAKHELADCNRCAGPRMGMPNWQCTDGRRGGPACKQLENGQCGWVVIDCPMADPGNQQTHTVPSQPPPPPPPPPPKTSPPPKVATPCGKLPDDQTLKTWKVVPVYKRYCGGAAPRNYVPPKEVRDLKDGTFIGESKHMGCFRGRWAQCRKKCLPPDTLIATPNGDIAVSELQVGMPVWSRDARGRRIAAVVRSVSKVEVSRAHRIVELRLADGRSVRVSAGHPAVGGIGVERLRSGALYDGSEIIHATVGDYGGETTFDLLPSGPTGIYWANDVPLESTLSPGRAD